MGRIRGLKCRECGERYPAEALHVCELCFGPLEVDYDYAAIAAMLSRKTIESGPPTMWRYKPLLPVEGDEVVDIGAGFTPLIPSKNLGEALGLNRLYLKNDTQNPTWSFKDRVVSVASTKALEFGFTTLSCASTGNLANAVAAHAARAGMDCYIFIPADLEPSKILGSLVYNPKVVTVEGNYDEVNRLCSELADHYPWAFVNINIRPYYAEGSKTLGYECVEQLGWRLPDHVVIPVASGAQYTKIFKAIGELTDLDLVEKKSCRLHGAQAQGCAPIADAFRSGAEDITPVRPRTIARSLAIGNPADGFYSLAAARKCGGVIEAVSDDEIVEGILLLASTEGIFAETAGGVTVAVLQKLACQGIIGKDDLTVALITGGGLKTADAVVHHLPAPYAIRPNLESFEAVVGNLATRTG